MNKLVAAAILGNAMALSALADTVVWYDFDSLGEAGTSVSHGSTIQNKSNPGTLDATVLCIMHGWTQLDSSDHMPVSAVGYPAGKRIFEPVTSAIATSADGAIKFTTPAKVSGNYSTDHGGAVQVQETASELSSGTFTLEMTIRLDPDDGFVKSAAQTFVCKTITGTDNLLSWEVGWNDGQIYFQWYDGDTAKTIWAGDIADGEWHHVAFVINPALGDYPVRKYVDYTALDGFGACSSLRSGTGPLTIGAQFSGSEKYYRNPARGVSIGEFRYSNAALTTAQFLTTRNVPAGRTLTYVTFDDETVNAAAEYGTLCEGQNVAPSFIAGSAQATFSEDVPGARILDGENGALITKNNTKSCSFAKSEVMWHNALDTYYLRKTLSGEDLTSFTIEFFFKPDGSQTDWSRLVSALVDGASFANYLYGLIFYNGKIVLGGNDASGGIASSAFSADGKWHHAAITVAPNASDATKSDVSFYLDYGTAKSGWNGTKTFTSLVTHPTTFYLVLGLGGTSANNAYKGLIDELRISAGALTPDQFLRAEKAPGLSIFVR